MEFLSCRWFVLSLVIFAARPSLAAAQDKFDNVEYVSGHGGMEEKVKGVLVIGDSLTFTKRDGKPVFSVPLTAITDITNQTDIRDASVGKKILFGGFSGSRKQDFVNVTYETDKTAEGLVFKVKQGTATGLLAKLKFAVKKSKEISAPATASKSDSTGTGR